MPTDPSYMVLFEALRKAYALTGVMDDLRTQKDQVQEALGRAQEEYRLAVAPLRPFGPEKRWVRVDGKLAEIQFMPEGRPLVSFHDLTEEEG